MKQPPRARQTLLPRLLLLGSLIVVVGLAGWIWSRGTGTHWPEVARARRLLERGEADLAYQAVAGIRDEREGAAEGLALAAQALLLRGKLAPARVMLERSLQIKPDQPEVVTLLSKLYLTAGEGRRAMPLLLEAVRLEPANYRPWVALAIAHQDLAETPEAVDAFTQALRRSPPPAEARKCRLGRLRAMIDLHNLEGASADLAELMKESPEDPKVLVQAARRAYELGNEDEASKLVDRSLRAGPDDEDALLLRARIRFTAHRGRMAALDLERALEIRPYNIAALHLLSQVQKNLGLAQEAALTQARLQRLRDCDTLMNRLGELIDVLPTDPEPRYRMGVAAMKVGMPAMALQYLKAALDLDPNHQPARDALKSLMGDMQSFAPAWPAARARRAEEPPFPE
ncbi:MAG: tetratricopeptide repeat protein [Isosphaeraceae bacterium]